MASEGVLDPAESGGTVDHGRRRFLTATTVVVGAVGVGFVAVPFIKSWNPSAKAKLAGAPITMDISALAEGQRLMGEWRGQPIWIVRRSKKILDLLPTLDPRLSDPESKVASQQPAYVIAQHPETRSIKPEISVLVGICTHLGCSPVEKFKAGPQPSLPDNWVGGFFCPCHGSTFDFSARVFKDKPAPANLVVPPYTYLSDTRLLIGEYKKA